MNTLSNYGEKIVGSEIIKISQVIKTKQAEGKNILNYTIGDFDSKLNPIPLYLKKSITKYYDEDYTNYPLSSGEIILRNRISEHLLRKHNINYSSSEILVGAGVRPLIYTIFKTLVDKGDIVVYPVPSWNNNHYSFLHDAIKVEIECKPENNFFFTKEDLIPYIKQATLICICTPQNPTGCVMDKDVLKEICDMIVEENIKRKDIGKKPCYLFFDQIYSELIYDVDYVHPLVLNPGLKDYMVCCDGISKTLCATGVRVGWTFGSEKIIKQMTEIFSHIGAWAPKPEQTAVANLLENNDVYDTFINLKIFDYKEITSSFYKTFQQLKSEGYDVDCIKPQGGIYLSIRIGYSSKFNTMEEFLDFIIDKCGLAIVPFKFFGSKENTDWFRLSIGYVDMKKLPIILNIIKDTITTLNSR